jgi:hypothetical protein
MCRLRDVLFLDLALELCGKGALEQGLAAVRAAAPSTLLGGLLALLQQPVASACLSALPGQGVNAALLAVASQLQQLSQDHAGARFMAEGASLLLNVCLLKLDVTPRGGAAKRRTCPCTDGLSPHAVRAV